MKTRLEVMEQIRLFVEQLIQMCGLHGHGVPLVRHILLALVAILLSALFYFLVKRVLKPIITKFTKKTPAKWDDIVFNDTVLDRFCQIVPAVVIFELLPLVFYQIPLVRELLYRITSIYITIAAMRLIVAVINSFKAMEVHKTTAQRQYMQSFLGVLKIVVVFISIIIAIALLIDKSPMSLFAGLGATSAVLMVVFKDTIEGLVAGIRLTSNDMVRLGDWITVPTTTIDGEVMEITLTTVKVRNFDNTIVTVSPKTLVNGSFQNWKGMQKSGGRRVKRLVFIDFLTVKVASDELKQKCVNKGYLLQDEVKGNVTNVGLYRRYMEKWIAQSSKVNTKLTYMVRQLEATNTGLPIEFYFFLYQKEWVSYEHILADMLEWAYVMMAEFGLRAYEKM